VFHMNEDSTALAVGAIVGSISGIVGVRAATRAAGGTHPVRAWTVLAIMAGTVAGVAMGAKFGAGMELAAFLLLVVVGLPLSAIDLAVRKVPDRILIAAAPAAIALLALAAHDGGTYGAFVRALLAGVAVFVAYLALALGTGQLGFGDCKAAAFCAVYLGFISWRSVMLGTLAAFVLAAVLTVVRILRGSSRTGTLAFAPHIFAGALLAVLFVG
jgi:leader peptidase (prepilin peptidase)/N-methyltransferase